LEDYWLNNLEAAIAASVMSRLMEDRVPLKRRRLYEDVIDHLEAAINSGEFKPGDFLPSERDLMNHFGVGRPSIREALFALRRMGLISMKAGERARVATPTPSALVGELSGLARHLLAAPDGMRNFQQARMLFESALAQHAARVATPDDIAALSAALRANKLSKSDPDAFEKTDVQFHFVIAQIARNPIFTALHAGLVEWLAEQRAATNSGEESRKMAITAHKKIYDAIAAHDPTAAGDAMRDHLVQVEELYWEKKGR
jgi:GntR family transcriptional repressor for pyruvate dehydrogenase complex